MIPNTLKTATMGGLRLELDEQIRRLSPVVEAIGNMRASRHTMDDWTAMQQGHNLLEAICRNTTIAKHWKAWRDESEATFASAYLRQRQTGSNVFTPSELDVFINTQHQLGQVLAVVTMAELWRCDEYMNRRFSQAQRGGASGVTYL